MATLEDWVTAVNAKAAADSGLDPVTARIMQQYGYMAGYLNHPEIGPLLREAAQKGWSKEILQGRLYATGWWQTMSAQQRENEMLEKTDPASWNQQLSGKATEIQLMAQKGGAYFSNHDELMQLARTALNDSSITPEILQYMVFSHAKYDPEKPATGELGSGLAGIKARAADFFVPMSDRAAFDWSRRVEMGVDTPETVDTYLRNQAKSRFSHFADDIDRGATVKQLFDPYIQQTAGLLEQSPDQINLMDKQWLPIISHKDPDSGKVRSMTLSEAQEYVKRSDQYDHTQGAVNEAAQMGETIAKTFGKVAA